jgi:hypothetical protein
MSDLKQSYNQLLRERMRMDKFFTLFLDKFERKMDPDKLDTPIWKLYRSKLKEYDDLSRNIKSTEYWLKKELHV